MPLTLSGIKRGVKSNSGILIYITSTVGIKILSGIPSFGTAFFDQQQNTYPVSVSKTNEKLRANFKRLGAYFINLNSN
jgi:hypothetical protein